VFKTRVTELLGIEYPIIQGAIQWLSRAGLVAAVSNAGGLGVISSLTFATPEELRQEIKKTRNMTSKPFAVNVTMLPTSRPVNYEGYFNAAIEEGVTIIETSGRSPEPYMKLLKDAGVKVMHRATRTRDLVTAERVGVDAVAIVGYEAAGHPGMEEVGSLVRIPVAVDVVKIPVIAAGGIADGRGMAAAMALGAEGILMGTRFLACQECEIHPGIKEWLIKLDEADTVLVMKSLKNAMRAVRTEYTEKILNMEAEEAPPQDMIPYLSGLRQKRVYETGDFNDAVMTVGQAVGLIHDIPSAKEIIERIIQEARQHNQRLNKLGLAD